MFGQSTKSLLCYDCAVRSTRTIAVAIGLAVILCVSCCSYFFWLPDLAGKVNLLAAARSQSGEQFKIVQFWGDDLYTTRLEQIGPDGKTTTAVIEGDATKLWSCSIRVREQENKLLIVLGDGSPPIEYRWDERRFVLPPGRERVRD